MSLFSSNSRNTAKTADKINNEFAELLKNTRSVSRTANGKVSQPMDTAIISSGLIGGNVKKIQEQTHSLHGQIGTASTAIEEIAANVRQFNKIIERQNTVLAQTSAAVEEMPAAVNSVLELTREKIETAEKLKITIEKGGEDVIKTAQSIDEVNTAIVAVTEIMRVINNIASQTNLLAMNAAIEAAHAGEFGKGFAVVATEVRKLAENTSENSKAIAASLKSIAEQIKDAKTAGERAGTSFTNIEKEVAKFVGAFSEISQSTNKLTHGTQQISRSMEDLTQVSSEISGGSKEIETGADSIESALRGINTFSTELVADMGVIEEKIYDLSGAQSGIVQYIVETNKNVEGFYQKMVESGDLEKENVMFNYELIVLMHRNWLIQLRAFLDDRKEGLKATSEDHLKCDLGRWIYGDGKHFESSTVYQTLETEHKNFHLAAGEIINHKETGEKSQAEEKYQKLMGRYHTVVGLLDKLRQEKL